MELKCLLIGQNSNLSMILRRSTKISIGCEVQSSGACYVGYYAYPYIIGITHHPNLFLDLDYDNTMV